VELRINVQADDPPEVVDEATRRLQSQLLELHVKSVERPVGEGEPGSRGAMTEIGTLLLQFAQTGVALTTVVGAVQGWLSARGKDRGTVKLEIDGDSIELPGGDLSPEQQRVVDAWVRRHES
jgi:Effector Associated Constant Component 1